VRSGSFRNSRGVLADLVSLALLWVRREGQGCTFSPLSAVIVQAMVISLSHTHWSHCTQLLCALRRNTCLYV